jgi:hypothetical protein
MNTSVATLTADISAGCTPVDYFTGADTYCALGFYTAGTTCTACPVGCAECVDAGLCLACQKFYTLNPATYTCEFVAGAGLDITENIALPCTTEHCMTCDANRLICEACIPGFELDSNNGCRKFPTIVYNDCGVGEFWNPTTYRCEECTDTNCAVCEGSTGQHCLFPKDLKESLMVVTGTPDTLERTC